MNLHKAYTNTCILVCLAASEDRDSTPEVFGAKVYNLDDSVDVWSDFLKIHLHPKSLQMVNSYTHET